VLKTQENDITRLIERIGLSVLDFSWANGLSRGTTPTRILQHDPTEFFYEFRTVDGQQYARLYPNENGGTVERAVGTWLLQLEHFWAWLSIVMREAQAPDLWAEAIAAAQSPAVTAGSNEEFSVAERESVAQLIGGLRQYITERADATDQRLEAVAEQLTYLADASERLGRKDWINAAIGVTLSIVVSGLISPDDARTAMQMMWHGLQGLVTGMQIRRITG
jgi:hypothetical protein